METAKEIWDNLKFVNGKVKTLALSNNEYETIKSERDEMIDFLVHLYVNYELPYGAMDVDTKQKFKQIIAD